MREACGNAQNGSDQSDNRKNIEDRLGPCRPLYDFQPQLDYFATDIEKFGLGLGPQIDQLRLVRQFRQFGGQEALHLVDARGEAV